MHTTYQYFIKPDVATYHYFIQDVKLFQTKFGFTLPEQYTQLTNELHAFRASFFDEELSELIEGCKTNDIELALDSIIDLLYITAGTALFHGLTPDEVYAFSASRGTDHGIYIPIISNEPRKTRPAILQQTNWVKATHLINAQISLFRVTHTHDEVFNLETNKNLVLWALTGIWNNCINMAHDMGVQPSLLKALWNDVQRANMTKVRATKATEGKRGAAAFDIVKPEGWVGPMTMQIINEHYDANSIMPDLNMLSAVKSTNVDQQVYA